MRLKLVSPHTSDLPVTFLIFMYTSSTYRLAQVMHNPYNGRDFLLDSVVNGCKSRFLEKLNTACHK